MSRLKPAGPTGKMTSRGGPSSGGAVGSSIRAGVLSSGTDERRNISLLREPGLASVTRPRA